MKYHNAFVNVLNLLLVVQLCRGTDLGSLIDGVTPVEEVTLDGTKVEDSGSDEVTIKRDSDGALTVIKSGEGILSVVRSTGISSGAADTLLKIVQDALGSRFHLMASLKRGGRLLTIRDTRRVKDVIDANRHKVEVYLNDSMVDISKASLLETTEDSSVLEPEGALGVRITMSKSGISVKSTSEHDVKIIVTRGLSKEQADKLRDNFYSILAKRTSEITGLPKPLIEIMISGRDSVVEKLSTVLGPAERVVVGGVQVDMEPLKKMDSSKEAVLEPKNMPEVRIIKEESDELRVESKNGKSIYVEYSKGVEPRLIGMMVDNLHRAITQRLGMISWSNKLIGSLPPHLESAIEEVKKNIQKRTIFLNDKEVDLSSATVVKTGDESVDYRIADGSLLTLHHDGTVESDGHTLALEVTPGISLIQASNLLSRINQIFSTAVSFTTDSGDTLLNDENNRQLIQSLIRGIKPKERITIDDQDVPFSNATVSKKESSFTEYKVDQFDDVTMTKFTDGDVRVVGKGRTLIVSRSTGISLGFLNRLVTAISDVMPKKRWFYNFGNKGSNNRGQKLQSIIEEIPKLVQKQTILIDGKKLDLEKTSILSVDDSSTVYTPDVNSKVTITKFSNGDIQAATKGEEIITVTVSPGITSQDAGTLIENIKKIVGDKIKIGSKRPEDGDFWCFPGDMRKLMEMLMNEIVPWSYAIIGSDDIDEDQLTKLARTSIHPVNSGQLSTRSLDKYGSKKSIRVSDNKDRGKIISSETGGRFKISFSTGLTEELTRDLADYVLSLLDNKEDVIRMVTGSLSEKKVRKIKDLIQEMIQENTVNVDSYLVTPLNSVMLEKTSNYTLYEPNGKKDVIVKIYKDDSVEILSSKNHKVSVAVSPGLTKEQAKQMYLNVLSAFKTKFSEYTNMPQQMVDFMSGFKRYLIKSYFFSAAPPKQFISVNGKEIRPLEMTSTANGSTFYDDGKASGTWVTIQEGGHTEVRSSRGGHIDVIKTTGLCDDQIERVLRAAEFKLGLKNKMFRILPDELFSPADKPESIDGVLKSLVAKERVFIYGQEVKIDRFKKIQSYEGCSLYKAEDYDSIILKRCLDGQISIDTSGSEDISLQILPGISVGQAKSIKKSLITTILKKSSNIKLLSNFPDIFLQLLADGRIKSLEKFLIVLIPKETVILDGKHVRLDSAPENIDPELGYQIIEYMEHPGLEVYRYSNGSLEIKSWNGGRLDITYHAGLSTKLLKLALETLKDHTAENLGPYFIILDEILKSNATILFNIIDEIIKGNDDSGIDVQFVMAKIHEVIQRRVSEFNINPDLVRNLAVNSVQRQIVYVDDEPVDMSKATVVESQNSFTVVTPENNSNIKITTYDNGRITVESERDEPIAVEVTAGVPLKQLTAVTSAVENLVKKFDSNDAFTNRLKAQCLVYLEGIYKAATHGIVPRRRILLDGVAFNLTKEIQTEGTQEKTSYEKDNTLVTIYKDGRTSMETSSASKVELDISSGLITEPVVSYLLNNSMSLAKEVLASYKDLDKMVPLMTKMEKILDGMIESLEQNIEIYVRGKRVILSNLKQTESTSEYRVHKSDKLPGLKITTYTSGYMIVQLPSPGTPLEVSVSSGLSQGDQEKLLSNVEALLSSFNPLQLAADFFDLLPKNFMILAQNMDRVIPVMNMIQF